MNNDILQYKLFEKFYKGRCIIFNGNKYILENILTTDEVAKSNLNCFAYSLSIKNELWSYCDFIEKNDFVIKLKNNSKYYYMLFEEVKILLDNLSFKDKINEIINFPQLKIIK